MMKSIFLLFITISLHAPSYARVSRTGVTYNVPKFGRQFISKYSLPDLGDDVCRITEEIVSLQQNCIDCMKNISSILITENGNKMYVGAKSLLLSVDMETCTTTNNLPYIGSISGCDDGPWECGNYLTKILPFQQNLLVACGTNYGNPEAILISHDLKMQEKEDLPRFCSQSPFWHSSYLQTTSHMFIGVNHNTYSSVITKYSYLQAKSLSSIGAVTTSEQWLNQAKFMTSFEAGNFVYFVMREGNERDGYRTAIGRVCKNDPGHSDSDSDQNVYSDNVNSMFLSFTKTYLTCKMALSEKQTLDFSVVSAATFNYHTRVLYGTFTQYLNVDIGGYSICGFDLAEIDTIFEGEYLTTDEYGKEVTQRLGLDSNNCQEFRMFHEANVMYVTSEVVEQNTVNPIYYELKKFTTILSDTVQDFTILYVGTNTGTVEKLVITSDNKVIPTSEFIVAESHIPIRKMQFLNEQNRMLVATTQETVARFPISTCGGHTELEQCIVIRDPHCCWCETSHSCSHINDCDRCVNDPMTGLVSQAFGRLASYEWRKEEDCVAVCPNTDETCSRGEKIIKYMKVYPKISEARRDVVQCVYNGPWRGKQGPSSLNVTDQEASSKFASSENGRLFKILSLCFGSLFVVSLIIIVFLMCYKSRIMSSRGSPNTLPKRKSFIDRTNSTNIISDKPISYMTNSKEAAHTTPMMRMIMPEDVTKVNNSPYRGDMTEEDEGLLQVHLGRRDHTENMYSDVHNHSAQTLPRNFGQHTLDRRNPTLPNYSHTLSRQSPQQYNKYNHNNTNNLNINQDLMRYVPGQNVLS